MSSLVDSVKYIFHRAGAGIAASQQGEYLHGWLPAMAERPHAPEASSNPSPEAARNRPEIRLHSVSHAGTR